MMKTHSTTTTLPSQAQGYPFGHIAAAVAGIGGCGGGAGGHCNSPTVRDEMDLSATRLDPAVDLTAVGALDATSISQIAELATTFIQVSWQPPSLLSSKAGGTQARASFKNFCSDVLIRTGVTGPIVLVALWFLERLRRNNPHVRAAQGAEFRLFATSLMLANKIMDDHRLLLRCWSQVTGIDTSELNIMEIEFLTSLNYRLHMSEFEYYQWAERINLELGRQHQRRIQRRQARSSPLGTSDGSPVFTALAAGPLRSSSPSVGIIQQQPQYMPAPPSPVFYVPMTGPVHHSRLRQAQAQGSHHYAANASSTEKEVASTIATLPNTVTHPLQSRRVSSLSAKTVGAALKQRASARIQPSGNTSSFGMNGGSNSNNHNSVVIPGALLSSSTLTQKIHCQLPRNHLAYQQPSSHHNIPATASNVSASSASYNTHAASLAFGGHSDTIGNSSSNDHNNHSNPGSGGNVAANNGTSSNINPNHHHHRNTSSVLTVTPEKGGGQSSSAPSSSSLEASPFAIPPRTISSNTNDLYQQHVWMSAYGSSTQPPASSAASSSRPNSSSFFTSFPQCG
ncbi:hypothetical protein SeMB42_g07740 [Synchytrium endobioticum]|uniref:Cyclin N-terminal domain-containing protein n=1 Tax=Synchytrium endobioticum TaxID=286115 RepID=A0A507BWU3_9FUNG|nr:hypothetical protein SeMB42_g07740 [Synchytrium endobioticum]TPX43364.1 hypothetical protein SeLEV6574_g05103 [Synchytrium endobioticum]